MSGRYLIPLAILLALLLYLASYGTARLADVGFRLGLFQKADEAEAVEESVALYNRISASFYNTGGRLEGLNEIPAGPLMKRRLFKDINMLKGDGLLLVFDRDRMEITGVKFMDRATAMAETTEVWALAFQEFKTRKPLSDIKAAEIKARYLLKKQDGRWIVFEVDVYPAGEEVPWFNVRAVL